MNDTRVKYEVAMAAMLLLLFYGIEIAIATLRNFIFHESSNNNETRIYGAKRLAMRISGTWSHTSANKKRSKKNVSADSRTIANSCTEKRGELQPKVVFLF